MVDEEQQEQTQAEWLGTTAAAKRLGITTRTLYRFIDEGYIAAYRMGRVIRVKSEDVDAYIESCRIEPGTISHLYPEVAPRAAEPPSTDD
ncbi:MAG: helix-turn-helix domain-containing protein [Acidimicrobiaceae bacterium]|nr:helix-turn-helix domain-containing protein [Acidimicrobiaceae bacterium]MXZ99535.1 helix-turn-helix domain-containing protein [Acidimicrobiaceae bacterium]MYE74973.1 helix-turn-helix domain-containing protein [Acidimicrobiaceae bacterium]MYH44378.1 helix-turn-helix domain-containing protein [Acidimicrobiaceae bacterium]MYI53454.1 helix-turn-helix domain-containing protein [Acidimicrobiaceae bacterium]